MRGTGGGPEKTILLGTAQTQRNRVDVTVCYIRDTRDGVFAIDEWARSVGVPYVEVPERRSFDLRVWSALRSLVRTRRIDIVHAHEYKTDLLALLLARAERVIPLATAHGWTGHSWRERRIYYPLDKRVLARFPRLIAVSGTIREELIRAGAPSSAVTTVLNGIDADRFRRDPPAAAGLRVALGIAPETIVIGAVGRLEPQKRFDLLIEAAASLRDASPHLHTLIVGDGSLKSALEAQIAAAGLRSDVTLLGHRTDVAALHSLFDLFVQSSDYEGTPNAVLEAMALQTPIVATDAGGTRDIARPDVDALIVPTGDVDGLRNTITRALSDRAGMASRARSARQRVETDLSFARRVRHIERIYEELMADGLSRDSTAFGANR